MPQRGYGLQPRVAASATLGKECALVQPRRGCVVPQREMQKGRNRAAVEILFLLVPRVAEAATQGWRPKPRWGINPVAILINEATGSTSELIAGGCRKSTARK
jgi:hypothetical protein